MSQKSVPPKKAPVVVAPTIAIPTPLLSPTTTSSQAAIPRASLSVQITGNGQDIQKLKQQLISDGFTSVTTVENSSVASSGTIITFSPRVTTDNQNIIVADAKKVTSKTIQAQTNPTATIDVSILLSK